MLTPEYLFHVAEGAEKITSDMHKNIMDIDCGVYRNRNRKTVLVVLESAIFDLQFTDVNKSGNGITSVLLHWTSQCIT